MAPRSLRRQIRQELAGLVVDDAGLPPVVPGRDFREVPVDELIGKPAGCPMASRSFAAYACPMADPETCRGDDPPCTK